MSKRGSVGFGSGGAMATPKVYNQAKKVLKKFVMFEYRVHTLRTSSSWICPWGMGRVSKRGEWKGRGDSGGTEGRAPPIFSPSRCLWLYRYCFALLYIGFLAAHKCGIILNCDITVVSHGSMAYLS
jgi:hypothetical protein